MGKRKALRPSQLYTACLPTQLSFKTTKSLSPLEQAPGHERAIEAIKFGMGIEHQGYNFFAMGSSGGGKHRMIDQFLNKENSRKKKAELFDWCYVHNFKNENKPQVLKLAPGTAKGLKEDMDFLMEDLSTAIPAAFESDEYEAYVQEINHEYTEQEDKQFERLKRKAERQGITLLKTPKGLALSPMHKNGEAMDPKSFEKLSAEKKQQLKERVEQLQRELETLIQRIPKWKREIQHKIREFNRVIAKTAVEILINDLKEKYRKFPSICKHLDEVFQDVVANYRAFYPKKQQTQSLLAPGLVPQEDQGDFSFERYAINVLVDHSETETVPIIYEANPTYSNLLGRVEYITEMGNLVTDFNLIKPGALHKANGGYLVIDADELLQQPFSWDGLKRTLRARKIKMESLDELYYQVNTVSIEPEPIPLEVKVILIGERYLYYLLSEYDNDFAELFKVVVDFEDDMPRNRKNQNLYARLIATIIKHEKLRHFNAAAVARVIEISSRRCEHTEKISLQTHALADLLRESDYWAKESRRSVVSTAHVNKALDTQKKRVSRIQERIYHEINTGTILINTKGENIGKINALTVLQLGEYAFGMPSRITARTRCGSGHVVDIEREVKLSGPIHSKGVLIISGYLSGHYIPDKPLSLYASIVFEQNYDGVEGDSASSTELYAILSALSGIPIKQSIAVTGSVNQYGEIQAIGGVNEKIEGFFAICQHQGLTGEQGVLIPQTNVKHLMLNSEVVAACKKGMFHVYAVKTIEEGIEILTGIPAGKRQRNGKFSKGTLNEKVESTLLEYLDKKKSLFKKEAHSKNPASPRSKKKRS